MSEERMKCPECGSELEWTDEEACCPNCFKVYDWDLERMVEP